MKIHNEKFIFFEEYLYLMYAYKGWQEDLEWINHGSYLSK